MRRKVASADLELGMYVVDLDRPWRQAPFEPPFEIQGFTLSDPEELTKVRGLCEYVYIDPNLGKGAKRYLQETYELKDITQVFSALPSRQATAEAVYQDVTSLQEELPTARQILKDTDELYHKITSDLASGRGVNEEEVRGVVTGLVESVVRNPEALAWLLNLKRQDETTYVHAISSSVLALSVGRSLGLPRERLEVLGTAALLQDVGKMNVPQQILEKQDALTPEEMKAVQEHVEYSVEMLDNARSFNAEIIHTVRLHHERYDGSGYPQGLVGDDIPILACISGIVDCYQAGTSNRPYRNAKTSFQVLMELYGARDALFPGGIVEQFIQCVGIFPIGSFVQLNTREIAVVVHRNQLQQLKPSVMIVTDPDGRRLEDPQTVDLTAQYLEGGQVPRLISKVVEAQSYNLDPSEFFA